MRSSLLSILKNSDDYVSGEFISSSLGVSRTSVWKHINALRNDGYIIEAKSNNGYKLIECADEINKSSILENLSTKFIGKEIFHYRTIDSTNTKAKELAKNGAKDGTLIISDIQAQGKGRFERVWSSPKGGLWFSIVLRPLISPIDACKITLIAAKSIFNTLKSFGLEPEIKWPNDILINNKKICGILTEMNSDMDKVNYVVIGIGINSNFHVNLLTNTIQNQSTTLLNECLNIPNNIEILSSLLKEFEDNYMEFTKTLDLSNTLEVIKNNSNIIGNYIYVRTIRNSFKAKCLDIDNEGNLILEDNNGKVFTQTSGEISSKPFAN